MSDSFWQSLYKVVLNIFANKAEGKTELDVSLPLGIEPHGPEEEKTIKPEEIQMNIEIDWTKGTSKVSKYFTVYEAVTLHSWNRLANEGDGLTDDVKTQIVKLC